MTPEEQKIAELLGRDMRLSLEHRAICEVEAEMAQSQQKQEERESCQS